MILEVHDLFSTRVVWSVSFYLPPRPKTFKFLGVAGGTIEIERSCYSPHYVNTERDYERDYQATLPQGRTAADGCKPRHGRDDRKRERSFSGLSFLLPKLEPAKKHSPKWVTEAQIF